jgi:hypothetical protein
MSGDEQFTSGSHGEKNVPVAGERRANLVLRALVDEMLERLRELNRNRNRWSEEEVERAQAELEAIMARVRRAAVQFDESRGG